MEHLQGVRQELLHAIDTTLDRCLTKTSLDGFGEVKVVRVPAAAVPTLVLDCTSRGRSHGYAKCLASLTRNAGLDRPYARARNMGIIHCCISIHATFCSVDVFICKSFEGRPHKLSLTFQGKVRDTYKYGEYLIIVTTDRQSAFDRILASVPFKGQVLNQTSTWWFNQTADMIPNALVATPDPCVAIMQQCEVFPVEFVVRGFMTGSTDTSLWTHYNNGAREYCGNQFPDGMVKNQRLQENVITPTTKSETHDVPISPAEILKQVLISLLEPHLRLVLQRV